jgi:catechol 2,3-dioxygenase-like lactoylglutathione lyase family enzyme
MQYEAIDHVIFPVADLGSAAPFERLGLSLTPPMPHSGLGTENRCMFTGGKDSLFYIELLRLADRAQAAPRLEGSPLLAALDEPRGLAVVVLRVPDLKAALANLSRAGIEAVAMEIPGGDGTKICDVASLPSQAPGAVNLALVQYTQPHDDAHASLSKAGLLTHDLPVKRLDHLAAIAPDLESATRFWTDVLGVPVSGEIATPVMIIRQFKIGDAIMELLGPATADSPMRSRPAGLVSMTALEVPDLAAAVAHARAAGFSAPDPATGVLPDTRTATIPATELSGLGLQLLEYV